MKIIKTGLLAMLAFSLLLSGCSANNTVQEGETEEIVQTESNLSIEEMKERINNTFFDWSEHTIDYITAVEILHKYSKSNEEEVSLLASEYLNYIEVEHEGYQVLSETQDLYKAGEYAKAMSVASTVSDDYSQKKHANTIYENCEKIILLLVSAPTSEKDYDDAIQYLDNCLKVIDNKKFELRKNELVYEYDVLKHVNQIVSVAQEQYESKQFKTSFETLEHGILSYPDNLMLKECLAGFQELFVIEVFESVEDLCEQKKYKEATRIVNVAKENYLCEEFDLLNEAIKERSNGLYKFGKDILRYVDSITKKWETEELTVEKVAENAGNYVVKSGKKLVLGDYSEDNVTVLSFGTNIVAALAGLDLAFDIRDLSYDVTHWGEDDYFLLYLAADVVALIPVIGAVKYFSYFDKASDGVKDVAKVADSIADSAKTVSKTADIIDELATASKNVDKISDVIDEASTAAKSSDAVTEAIDNIKTGYKRYYATKNHMLDGQQHPVTGVLFAKKEVELTYADDFVGVFPKFDSLHDLKLPDDLLLKSDAVQFRECNKSLYEAITKDESLRLMFTEDEIKLLKNGESPTNWKWTWHHNEDEGIMQLVDREIHSRTGHDGGRLTWGGGTECRSGGCSFPVEN